jgi:hypothetical protein
MYKAGLSILISIDMVIRDGKIKGGKEIYPTQFSWLCQTHWTNVQCKLSRIIVDGGVVCVILPDLVYNLPDPPPGPYACVYRVYECLMIEEPRMMLLLCNSM